MRAVDCQHRDARAGPVRGGAGNRRARHPSPAAQLDTILDLAERRYRPALPGSAQGARLVKLLAATRSVGQAARDPADPRCGSARGGLSRRHLAPRVIRRRCGRELGDSFEANARHKAEYFARLSGLPTFADDSGLEVFSLGGAPGVHSNAGPEPRGSDAEIDAANNAELLRRLAGAPEQRRLARYRCVLFYLPSYGAVPTICQGDCTGRILEAPRGSNGFGYDPYFFSDELGKTFGEASERRRTGSAIGAGRSGQWPSGSGKKSGPQVKIRRCTTGCGAVR